MKILLTDHHFPTLEYLQQVGRGVGASVVEGRCKDEADVLAVARDADALLTALVPIRRPVIAALERCRIIVRLGIGYDIVDVDAATERGIPVCNIPDYCLEEVSEHALALLLALARKVVLYDRMVRGGEWSSAAGGPMHPLRGRILGIIGLGKIGRRLAGKARGLGLEVWAYDPYLADDVFEAFGARRAERLEDLLRASDFVSIHTPLTAETRGMIGAKELGWMKRGAYLINTARGAILREGALAQAVAEGRIAGAALDVLETEPPPADWALRGLENIILTPHAAWNSEESVREMQRKAAEDVGRALRGERPRNVVNPSIYWDRPS